MWWKKVNEAVASYGLIPLLLLTLGLAYQYGQFQSAREDLMYLRGKVDGFHTSVELIKAKINNEIIPRLNNDPNVKTVAGIPIQKSVTLGELRYNWVIPYKARGGESVGGILKAAGVSEDPDKVKEVVATNPDGFEKAPSAYAKGFVAAPGAIIFIPVSDNYIEKLVKESAEFKEKLHWKVIPAPTPSKESVK